MFFEYPLNRWRKILFNWFLEYLQLPNLGLKKPPFNLIGFIAVRKVTVWCGFNIRFTFCPKVYEKLSARGPRTLQLPGIRYVPLLKNNSVLDFSKRHCLSRNFFLQDGTSPHINLWVMDVLKRHITKQLAIHCDFTDPCLLCLWTSIWGNFKHLVSRGNQELNLILKIAFYNIFAVFLRTHYCNLYNMPSYDSEMLADNDGSHNMFCCNKIYKLFFMCANYVNQ